jgi:pimeloyl-ACP methyl ester carboxylesterase
MAAHIDGPLYYERMGRTGPVVAFVHPNPMDQSCWIYQMAHLSTWFRCIAIDIPGYGRSPKSQPGLTMDDMAAALWAALDEAAPGETSTLVGCSVGAQLVPFMYHQRPQQTSALVMCGSGYNPGKEFIPRRIGKYTDLGINYRWDYTFDDFSPGFRATPMARYFADLFAERNDLADLPSIIRQFEAMAASTAESHHAAIACPTLLITGSEDAGHARAFDLQKRIPGCELKTVWGAGHACQIEQPWLFDQFMLDFLTRHGLFLGSLRREISA